jgi:hypothetical protein
MKSRYCILLTLVFSFIALTAGAAVSPLGTGHETPLVPDRPDGCEGAASRATINVPGDYTTIQAAIDDAGTVAGDTILIAAGTYNESITISKSLTLTGVPGSAASTIITGASTTAVTVSADDVTITWLTVTNPAGKHGIYANDRSNLTVNNCIVTNVGSADTTTTGTIFGIAALCSAVDVDGITITDNEISAIDGGDFKSVDAIAIGWSNGGFNFTNVLIKNNTIFDIDSSILDYSAGGRGAYGIIINHTTGSAIGQTIAPVICNNTIYDVEGLWATGIGLEGKTPDAQVKGNLIDDLTHHKTTPDAQAVKVEDNAAADTVEISYNSFTNVELGVANYVSGSTVNAEKNWWGTTNSATIAGMVYGAGSVDYSSYLLTNQIRMAFVGNRLADMQYTDGGWGWPLTAPPTFKNIHAPITMGLAKAYRATGDPDLYAALEDAGAFFLTKTNDFSPTDGYLAAELDAILGGSTYMQHVWVNFYTPLANGTYDRNGAGTLYDTAGYIQLIHDSRASIPNIAAWDIGMGLAAAVTAGVSGSDLDAWIAGTEAEIDNLDGADYYDVIGLAGAIYGLASAGADFDPTAGEHAAAGSLSDLADILALYQIFESGGFAWNKDFVIGYDCNEAAQETAYAALALAEMGGYESEAAAAAEHLLNVQLCTGGWGNYCSSSENNEVSAEGAWGIWGSDPSEITLLPDSDCYTTGETVTVELWMNDVADDIVGGQFFLSFDDSVLSFGSAVGFAPFQNLYLTFPNADEINYALNISAPGSTTGTAQIATLTFTALGDICSAADLITWRAHVPPTRLSGAQGQPIYPDLQAMDVFDNEAPSITCPTDFSVQCPGDVPADYVDLSDFLTAGGTATDNCSTILDFSVISDSGLVGGGCGGTVTRVYRVTDHCGNWAECTHVITLDDTTPPVFTTCPPLVSIECSDDSSPGSTGMPTVLDNCDPAPVITYADVVTPGACPQAQTITRTWTATDSCDNVGTCVQTITVQDTTPPVITCPDDVTALADAGGCSATLPIATCYGDISYAPGYAAQHFDDVYNLTTGDLVLTYTVDMSQVTQSAAYETPYVEVGLRQVGAGDFNPGGGSHPGGAGGWMTSLVGDLATDPNNLDLDDKHNLSAAGGAGEGSYDATDPDTVVVPPFGNFNTIHIWYDRDGVDQWQALSPWNVDGGNYNTGGVYEIEIRYHAISSTQGTMFSTINGMQPGFDTTGDGNYDVYPGGIQFTGDMTQMQVFSGAWYTGGAGGNVEVTDICVSQPPTAILQATATDNCDPNPTITWVRDDGKTSLSDPYDVADSPITITWTATDACNNSSYCDQTVTVDGYSEMVVDLSLDGTPVTPLDRCITFELFDCSGGTSVEVTKMITFTGGSVTDAVVLVPCGVYTCVTARDALHTLARTVDPLHDFGTQYDASFSNPLLGGNLNDDDWVDILDFGVFSYLFGPSTAPTDCNTAAPHADIDGDGLVNSDDFSYIQTNFLKTHDPDCCSGPAPLGGSQPVVSVSVQDLIARGLGHLAAGDLNNDGWLDQADIVAFMQGARPDQMGVGGVKKPLMVDIK